MISHKKFVADGKQKRFLSDFKIMSEQYARVYMYWRDLNLPDGADAPCGLKNRWNDTPNPAEDLINLNQWDLIDNSIAFYDAPCNGAHVYIEVATNPEEFGNTLIPGSVLSAWVAAVVSHDAAERAEQAKDTAVIAEDGAEHWEQNSFEWSSNPPQDTVDDGIRTGYSAYHWSIVAKNNASGKELQGDWDPNSGDYPSGTFEDGDWWLCVAAGTDPDGRDWLEGDELIYMAGTYPAAPWTQKSNWVPWDRITSKPTTFPPDAHDHTISEISDWPTEFPPEAHDHNDLYYTKTETDAAYSPITHTHAPGDISPQGANSGLDADMLDGNHADAFPKGSWSVDAGTATLYITIT